MSGAIPDRPHRMAVPVAGSGTPRKGTAMNSQQDTGRPSEPGMSSPQIVRTFLEFFRERGHHRILGGSLVPRPADPVLFTTSGMHPLTPYLEGQPHPDGRRLTDVQRCLRTTDLDEVGDRTHLTLFEMLGSWSLGDYSGSQSLRWGHELITSGFGIDPGLLHATVFGGSDQVSPDTGLAEVWVELWNHVMLRWRRLEDGTLMALPRPNVDTGMGLERLATVLQDQESVFGCDLLQPWTTTLGRLWPAGETSLRLVSDHLRSSMVVIGDGVTPSSTGRGYVLRRLIRRALTSLWRDDPARSLSDLPLELTGETLNHFGQLTTPGHVMGVLLDEERRFRDLLNHGRRVLSRRRGSGPLTEEELRYLHETHGLPPEFVPALLPS